jgi:hypothetical protein
MKPESTEHFADRGLVGLQDLGDPRQILELEEQIHDPQIAQAEVSIIPHWNFHYYTGDMAPIGM